MYVCSYLCVYDSCFIQLWFKFIEIEENRKLNVSKYLYECSQGEFKIMPIYQMNDNALLQIKEKFIDRFKPKLNKT